MEFDVVFYLAILFVLCIIALLFILPIRVIEEKISTKFNLFTGIIISIPSVIIIYFVIRFLMYSL